MGRQVVGGTFSIGSAMGKYPYGVPYNVDGPALARLLSRLPDINVVSVAKTVGADGGLTVAWRVTFTYQVRLAPPLPAVVHASPSPRLPSPTRHGATRWRRPRSAGP